MLVRSVATLVGSALLAGCSVAGVRAGTEQPKYELVDTIGDTVEVRLYGERTAAEVTVQRGLRSANENSAFGALAGYIFGKNKQRSDIAMTSPVQTQSRSQKIAMTSPVESTHSDDGMTMRFFLPSSYTVETAPEPLNKAVSIVAVEPSTVATLRFSGLRSSGNVATHTAQLLQHLESSKWQPMGAPAAYFYDPPWTVPSLRRNEVVIPVKKRAS